MILVGNRPKKNVKKRFFFKDAITVKKIRKNSG